MYLYVSRHVAMYFLALFLLQISKRVRTTEGERERGREREGGGGGGGVFLGVMTSYKFVYYEKQRNIMQE